MYKKHYIALLILVFPIIASALPLSVKDYDNYTRIIVPIQDFVDSEIKKDKGNKIIISLKNFKGENLSAGSETSKFVSKINLNRDKNKYEIEIISKEQNIEFYSFRNFGEQKITIDLWKKTEEPRKIASAKIGKSTEIAAQPNLKQTSIDEKIQSQIKASADDLTKAMQSNSDDFHKQKLSEKRINYNKLSVDTDIILDYPITNQRFDFAKVFSQKYADDDYKYPENDSKDRVGVHYRVVKKLYDSRQYALALKGIDMFMKHYNESAEAKYFYFIEANAYAKLGEKLNSDYYKSFAKRKFRELIDKFPDEQDFYTFYKVEALQAYNDGIDLHAIELLSIIEMHPSIIKEHEKIPIKLALAESYIGMKEYTKALGVLKSISEGSDSIAEFAIFRIGDVYAKIGRFDLAIEAFKKGNLKFKDKIIEHRGALYNFAESFFREGVYEKAKIYFNEFKEKYASDEFAAYAAVRYAEIKHIYGDSPVKAYENVINSYPFSFATKIANLRLILIDMNSEVKKRFYQEILEKYKSEKNGDGFLALTKLQEIRLTNEMGNYEKAYLLNSRYISDFRESIYAKYGIMNVGDIVMRGVNEKIKENIPIKILEYYSTHKLELDELNNAGVKKTIADSYFKLGLHEKALEFEDSLKRDIASGFSFDNKNEKDGFQYIQSLFDLGYLDKLGQALDKFTPTSPLVIAKTTYMKAYVNEFNKNEEVARDKYLEFSKISEDKKLHSDSEILNMRIKTLSRIGKHEMYDRRYESAQSYFEKMHQLYLENVNTMQMDDEIKNAIFSVGDTFLYRKNYKDAIDRYEKGLALTGKDGEYANRASYNLALAYLQTNRKVDAANVLKEMSKLKSDNIWITSAKKELEILTWEQNYGRGISSIK